MLPAASLPHTPDAPPTGSVPNNTLPNTPSLNTLTPHTAVQMLWPRSRRTSNSSSAEMKPLSSLSKRLNAARNRSPPPTSPASAALDWSSMAPISLPSCRLISELVFRLVVFWCSLPSTEGRSAGEERERMCARVTGRRALCTTTLYWMLVLKRPWSKKPRTRPLREASS